MPNLARWALAVPLFSSLLVLGCDFKPRRNMTSASPGLSPAQATTVEEMGLIGQALVSWQEAKVNQPSSGSPPPCEGVSSIEGPDAVRVFALGKIPHVTWEELKAELVPRYLQALPLRDAWGKAYDFRVNLLNPKCPDAISLRSAGADGSFGYAHYRQIGYDPADEDQDLVWASGNFVRFPDPKMAKR